MSALVEIVGVSVDHAGVRSDCLGVAGRSCSVLCKDALDVSVLTLIGTLKGAGVAWPRPVRCDSVRTVWASRR